MRVFYQLDNLQLDPLPAFKLSPSVFLNTEFNPRNDDTDRKNPAISHFLGRSGFPALCDPLENTRNLSETNSRMFADLFVLRADGAATAEGHKLCINRRRFCCDASIRSHCSWLCHLGWEQSLSIPPAGERKGFCPCKDDSMGRGRRMMRL